mmetsp:Transcript_142314/g.345865  ORF Transcript_142314/g.345865 Transcript_142314/m.345865 type:complete len:1072 (+) Transcript_142314:59-3274(+)
MASKEPHWGSKNGSLGRPGFSPYRPPDFKSEYGALVGPGSDLTPLIDESGFIYMSLGGRWAIQKVDDDFAVHWRIGMKEERGGVAGNPALSTGTLLYYTEKGWAVCLDTATGTEKWASRFAAGGSVMDMGSAAVHGGLVIVSGKEAAEDEALGFNRDIFALDVKTGAQKWTVRMKLGLSNLMPVVADNLVVFQSISGEVACHSFADGASKWMTKPAGQVSTGSAVICKETGLVYSTGNLRGKKEWNAPRGGKGVLRAFSLKTGELAWQKEQELECSNAPIVAPVGPSKRLLVIYGLGSNTGTWKEPLGDDWYAFVAAADAKTGERVWQTPVENLKGCGPGCTRDEPRFRTLQTVCWSTATACGGGQVFIGWHGAVCYQIDGATGELVTDIGSSGFFAATPAVGPGMLIVTSNAYTFIFRNRPVKGNIVRELEAPLSESGVEHFWPSKMKNLEHTEYSELPATTDLTKPAFVAADIYKHFARGPGMDFYHKTPVVDSQGNIYVNTNGSRIIIVKRDGTIRGTINIGYFAHNPCLHDRYLYTFNGAGYITKVDIETLEAVMNRKYCDYSASDSWNPVVCAKHQIILTVAGHRTLVPGQVGGNSLVMGLRTTTGEVAWFKMLQYITYNFLPSVFEDRDYFIFSDNGGGLYCLKISDGSTLWEDLTFPDCIGSFTTGHCASAPNGMVYNAYNLPNPKDKPFGVWNRGAGAGGVIRANVIETGERKWLRHFECECHVAPVVSPKGSGSDGFLVVAAQGSQGGYAPFNEDDVLEDDSTIWPSGDSWPAWVAAFDADNGDEVWRFDLPIWNHYEARGSFAGDIFLPDCFGSPTASSNGHVYIIHWSGTAYCLETATGKVVSSSDAGGSSQSAPVIVPGSLLMLNAWNLVAFRDEKLELDWLEKARASGDKRADPRLWVHREQELTKADKEALDLALHVHPEVKEFTKTSYKEIPLPFKAYSEETFLARVRRMSIKFGMLPPDAAPEPSGKGPSVEAAQAEAGEGPFWVVVGGGKAGGITVRKDVGLKSAELGRLSTGARVRQLGLQGERLHYERLSGEGPDSGWVSLSFKGADLVKRA